uniref:uncharacterized protein LOC131108007 isoform X2 n=1 Tax=Doryrhamphus excisus TaxID=161450 RepID=UPI0025AE6CD0|nr:uncharacterized protein LOC131108007 isoform X2 [Doryrhamphus excisus]
MWKTDFGRTMTKNNFNPKTPNHKSLTRWMQNQETGRRLWCQHTHTHIHTHARDVHKVAHRTGCVRRMQPEKEKGHPQAFWILTTDATQLLVWVQLWSRHLMLETCHEGRGSCCALQSHGSFPVPAALMRPKVCVEARERAGIQSGRPAVREALGIWRLAFGPAGRPARPTHGRPPSRDKAVWRVSIGHEECLNCQQNTQRPPSPALALDPVYPTSRSTLRHHHLKRRCSLAKWSPFSRWNIEICRRGFLLSCQLAATFPHCDTCLPITVMDS